MKKAIIYLLLLALMPMGAMAQSSMTDDQVMQFVVKEHGAGTSNAQIVTKLMQRGVDISQIRRIRSKYQRQIDQGGLGSVADQTVTDAENRMRQNNSQKRTGKNTTTKTDYSVSGQDPYDKTGTYTNGRISGNWQYQRQYDETDPTFLQMQDELGGLLPTDSIEWLNQILEQQKQDRKKVFGRDIFNNENLSFEPNMNIATPQNYVIGPGDAVNIDVYGASQKSVSATVSPDGDVVIEGFGPVHVSGLTVSQANARIRSTMGARYSSSKVRLTLGQTRTITVNVMGEVKAPGTYTLSAFASVFHALYMSGGPNDLGTLRNIKVYRNNRLVTVVDIYDYILNGKLSGNVRLADNDVIVVGPYDCLVDITGKVKRPMFYEMKRNESVGTLLKYAGGFTGDAYTKAVRVTRKTGRERAVFNVGEFDMAAFHVADGDSVSVDSILPRYENTVEIKGAVFRPGMYQLGGGITTVKELLEGAEGVTEQAFTAHAVMHRMKPDRTLKVIPVDVEGILSGRVADISLQENDVLFVPTKGEAMQKRTVTIHGEVQYPGIYEYADNETIEDFVLQAGGLKETASTVKVDVARRTSNPAALEPDSVIAETYSLSLKDGFVVDGQPGFTLMPYDEVYVRKSPAYTMQQNITVEGQAMFPGTYTLSSKNERLSDIIKKAGGVTDLAYVEGARLERRMTQEEILRRQTLLDISRMQGTSADSLILAQLSTTNSYYVGIELDKALANPGGDADIVLRQGDRLIVPEYNATVKISGAVMFPNTVAYERGKGAGYYIDQAGGWGNRARKSKAYIVYLNGTVARVGHGAKIRPGCEIVVPQKEKSTTSLAQTMSIATSVASFGTVIATLANILK